jgi:hypothetical protein
MKRLYFLFSLSISWFFLSGQSIIEIPSVYTNFHFENGELIFKPDGSPEKMIWIPSEPTYYFDKITKSPTGTENGIKFDFKDTGFYGKIYYGFIATENGYNGQNSGCFHLKYFKWTKFRLFFFKLFCPNNSIVIFALSS